jgi:hypothetical protein
LNTTRSERSTGIGELASIPIGSKMPTSQQIRNDLDYILTQAQGTTTMLDELSLIRIAIRRYAETGNAEEAVAWAAGQISNSVSNYKK